MCAGLGFIKELMVADEENLNAHLRARPSLHRVLGWLKTKGINVAGIDSICKAPGPFQPAPRHRLHSNLHINATFSNQYNNLDSFLTSGM